MKPFYIAAKSHEGCGHEHRTAKAANKCVAILGRRGLKLWVYKVTNRDPWKAKRV